MRPRDRRHSISVFVLVLAAAGLLMMHGLDAGSMPATHQGDAATSSLAPGPMRSGPGEQPDMTHGAPGSARSMSAGDAGVAARAGGADNGVHVGWGHVVAMCVVVLATVTTVAARHLLGRVRAPFMADFGPGRGGLAPSPRVCRPPGPRWLELCVLTC